MKTIYVCTGGCAGKVSAEKYAAGKTTCGTLGCARFGLPLEERQECEICGAIVHVGEAHGH